MGKIKIDGSSLNGQSIAERYEQQVTDVLATIRKNRIGDIIASSIEGVGRRKTAAGIDYIEGDHDLTIVPFDAGKAALLGETNAVTEAEDASGAAPKGVSERLTGESAWYRGRPSNPKTGQDERYSRMPYPLMGTGKGSNSRIYFSPDKSGSPGGAFGSQPDEVLLHEMVHALREMQGKANAIPTEGSRLRNYDNEEEFLAVVVTNVYMSGNNKSQLRADHHGHTPLDRSLSTSAGFLTDPGNLRLMNIYKLIWQPAFSMLHTVSATFNPFRELTLRLSTPYDAYTEAFDPRNF